MLLIKPVHVPTRDGPCFFFRPTPSWLSPGRYTFNRSKKDELQIGMQGRQFADNLKSAGNGPIHKLEMGLVALTVLKLQKTFFELLQTKRLQLKLTNEHKTPSK